MGPESWWNLRIREELLRIMEKAWSTVYMSILPDTDPVEGAMTRYCWLNKQDKLTGTK